jgi:hypothetical protein
MKLIRLAAGWAGVVVLGIAACMVFAPAAEEKPCVCGHQWEQHDKGNDCKDCSCQRFKMPVEGVD